MYFNKLLIKYLIEYQNNENNIEIKLDLITNILKVLNLLIENYSYLKNIFNLFAICSHLNNNYLIIIDNLKILFIIVFKYTRNLIENFKYNGKIGQEFLEKNLELLKSYFILDPLNSKYSYYFLKEFDIINEIEIYFEILFKSINKEFNKLIFPYNINLIETFNNSFNILNMFIYKSIISDVNLKFLINEEILEFIYKILVKIKNSEKIDEYLKIDLNKNLSIFLIFYIFINEDQIEIFKEDLKIINKLIKELIIITIDNFSINNFQINYFLLSLLFNYIKIENKLYYFEFDDKTLFSFYGQLNDLIFVSILYLSKKIINNQYIQLMDYIVKLFENNLLLFDNLNINSIDELFNLVEFLIKDDIYFLNIDNLKFFVYLINYIQDLLLINKNDNNNYLKYKIIIIFPILNNKLFNKYDSKFYLNLYMNKKICLNYENKDIISNFEENMEIIFEKDFLIKKKILNEINSNFFICIYQYFNKNYKKEILKSFKIFNNEFQMKIQIEGINFENIKFIISNEIFKFIGDLI